MAIKELGGVFVRVTNLERSIPFYSALGLRLRGIEDWNPGRGATFFISPEHDGWPLLTLVESDDLQVLKYPPFNLNSVGVRDMHRDLQAQGFKVSELEEWRSPWNDHCLFDVFDPDGNMICLIEVTPIEQKEPAAAGSITIN